jgi:hypothetical protein
MMVALTNSQPNSEFPYLVIMDRQTCVARHLDRIFLLFSDMGMSSFVTVHVFSQWELVVFFKVFKSNRFVCFAFPPSFLKRVRRL